MQRREHDLLDRIAVERRTLIGQAEAFRRPLRNVDRVGQGLRKIRRLGSLSVLLAPGAVALWRARPMIRLGLRIWTAWKLLRRVKGNLKSTFSFVRSRTGRRPVLRGLSRRVRMRQTAAPDRLLPAGLSAGFLAAGSIAGGLLAQRVLNRMRKAHQEQWT